MKEKCPVCGELFSVGEDLDKGELIYCTECYADLKVIETKPLRLKEVEIADDDDFDSEDQDDDDDDDSNLDDENSDYMGYEN